MTEKQTSTFEISNLYWDKNREQKATVQLSVDYKSKSYSIKNPFNCGGEFAFIQSSHKHAMWKAVIKSIDEAIDFANTELEIK